MDGDTHGYFSPDYGTARRRFQESAERAGAQLESLRLDAKGPAGEDLGIDVAWFGSENPRRVVLHSSGIHGVEGFAGSAIQLQLLENLPRLPEHAALIIAHVLNPYGMAWLRRVNENNVDLNRNFPPDGAYRGAPPAYAKLDSFLNPQSPPSSDFFIAKAVCLILKYGMPALKQTIAGGQYEYAKGLFFGGKALQQGLQNCQEFLQRRLASAESILAIDVHTGLGKYAEDTLLKAPGGPDYRIQGGLPNLLSTALPTARVDFIGQEFGTYHPVKVLHALREENRWHHYGAGTLNHPVKRALKQAFCPDDESWRSIVLSRGRDLLTKIRGQTGEFPFSAVRENGNSPV